MKSKDQNPLAILEKMDKATRREFIRSAEQYISEHPRWSSQRVLTEIDNLFRWLINEGDAALEDGETVEGFRSARRLFMNSEPKVISAIIAIRGKGTRS